MPRGNWKLISTILAHAHRLASCWVDGAYLTQKITWSIKRTVGTKSVATRPSRIQKRMNFLPVYLRHHGPSASSSLLSYKNRETSQFYLVPRYHFLDSFWAIAEYINLANQ
ncbi:hypothetical protein F4679DRAFT_561080 [Xylaria curta]|nr:hypothetical protein F4679DRAFT_561080 [Xylaria curta]